MKQANVIKNSQGREKVNPSSNATRPGYFARLRSRILKSKGEDLNLETWQRLEFRDRVAPCSLRDVINDVKWRF